MSSAITVELQPQSARPSLHALTNEWTFLRYSFGIHDFREHSGFAMEAELRGTLRISNGVANAPGEKQGSCYLNAIKITFPWPVDIIPRRGISKISRNVIQIGAGLLSDCVRGQARIVLDWVQSGRGLDVFTKELPHGQPYIKVGDVRIPLPKGNAQKWRSGPTLRQAIVSGVKATDHDLNYPAAGFVQPTGWSDPGEGGGKKIDPVNGREQDYETLLLEARLAGERMYCDQLDYLTGEPLADIARFPEGYALGGMPTKSAVSPTFWSSYPPDYQYAYQAAPKFVNSGSSPYTAQLHGGYDGMNGYNGEHYIRAFGPQHALHRLFGDKCAAFDLKVLHANATYAFGNMAGNIPMKGAGSGVFGRRQTSWVGYLATIMGKPHNIGRGSSIAQMENGGIMSWPSSMDWFSPSAWRESEGVPDPLELHQHAEQSMERWITVIMLVASGCYMEAEKACAREFLERDSVSNKKGYVPKYFCVAEDTAGGLISPAGAKVMRKVTRGAGKGDYFPPMALGMMACLDMHLGKDPSRWIAAMVNMPTPTQGKATSVRDLYDRYCRDSLGRWQLTLPLSALERHLGLL